MSNRLTKLLSVPPSERTEDLYELMYTDFVSSAGGDRVDVRCSIPEGKKNADYWFELDPCEILVELKQATQYLKGNSIDHYFSDLFSEGKLKTFERLSGNQVRISPDSLDVADWQRFYAKFRPSVSKRLACGARQLKDTEAFLPATSKRRVKGVVIVNSGDYNLPTDLLFRLTEWKMKREWKRKHFSTIDFVSCMTVDMYRSGGNILHSRHIARTTRDSDIVEAIKYLHDHWLLYVGAAMGVRIQAGIGGDTGDNHFDLSTPFAGKIFAKE